MSALSAASISDRSYCPRTPNQEPKWYRNATIIELACCFGLCGVGVGASQQKSICEYAFVEESKGDFKRRSCFYELSKCGPRAATLVTAWQRSYFAASYLARFNQQFIPLSHSHI